MTRTTIARPAYVDLETRREGSTGRYLRAVARVLLTAQENSNSMEDSEFTGAIFLRAVANTSNLQRTDRDVHSGAEHIAPPRQEFEELFPRSLPSYLVRYLVHFPGMTSRSP